MALRGRLRAEVAGPLARSECLIQFGNELLSVFNLPLPDLARGHHLHVVGLHHFPVVPHRRDRSNRDGLPVAPKTFLDRADQEVGRDFHRPVPALLSNRVHAPSLSEDAPGERRRRW